MIVKYRRITIKILMLLILLISIFFVDIFILPQQTVNDEITSYRQKLIKKRRNFSPSTSEIFVGYFFNTQKGYHFTIAKTLIEERAVTLEHSRIFNNITGVKTKKKDYSDELISDLNGACLYFLLTLTITIMISLLILFLDKNLTENGFQNILLLNSLLIFYIFYLLFLDN